MGSCSANIYKISTETQVTLTLKPINKKVTFNIDKSDIINQKVKVNQLDIGEKSFVPFMVLCLVCYML